MTLDLRSRDFSVTIYDSTGSNPVEVTDAIVEGSISESSFDQSGWIYATGSLTLHSRAIAGLDFDSRTNPTRWAKGNKVVFEIANAIGSLVTYPRGILYLAKDPLPPQRGDETIQLDLGCKASLLAYRSPPDDQSGVERGINSPRTDVLNAIGTAAGLGLTLADSLPFPINTPLFRLDGGYIEQMGAIAFAAGYVLWIDCSSGSEVLSAKAIDLAPSAAILELETGVNDSDYEFTQDGEPPVERVYATSVSYDYENVEDPEPTESIRIATFYSVFNLGVDLSRRIIVETSRTEIQNIASNKPITTTTKRRCRGLVFPNQFVADTYLMLFEISTSTRFYDGNGRLDRETELTEQPLGYTMSELYPVEQDLGEAQFVETEYFYFRDNTQRILISTYQPLGVVNLSLYLSGITSAPSPTTRVLVSQEERTWKKVGDGWLEVVTTSTFTGTDATSGSTSTYSQTGNQPPAPEYKQQDKSEVEKPLVGKASFTPIAGANFSDRSREYQFPPGVAGSVGQLNDIAELMGGVLIGRHRGLSWSSDLDDAWLVDYEPLSRIDWTDGANTFSYLADAVSLGMTSRECAIACNGIWIGTRKVSGSGEVYIEPPYSVAIEVEMVSESLIEVVSIPEVSPEPAIDIEMISGSFGEIVDLIEMVSESLIEVSSGESMISGVVYSGNSTTNAISGDLGGETTDYAWIYARTNNQYSSMWAAALGTASDTLASFDADGITLGSNSSPPPSINESGTDYVAWLRYVDGSTFDVATWSGDDTPGREIAIALSAPPTVMLIYRRTGNIYEYAVADLVIYHESIGATAVFDIGTLINVSAEYFNDTAPTATTVTLGYGADVNAAGADYIGFFFNTPAGSYTGDGSDPGIEITTSAEPQQLSILSIYDTGETIGSEWVAFDSTRNPSNPRSNAAQIKNASGNSTETTTGASVDFGTDSFTPNADSQVNESGRVYYWWLF